jgi:hypothetical protein
MNKVFRYLLLDIGSILAAVTVSALIIAMVTGCSTGNLKRTRTLTDGTVERVELNAYAIGTNQVLNGLAFSTSENGGLDFNVSGLDTNQTKGLEEVSKITGLIVEGAVKGAVKATLPTP